MSKTWSKEDRHSFEKSEVKINENAQLPRIVLACMFFNDPIDYLKND